MEEPTKFFLDRAEVFHGQHSDLWYLWTEEGGELLSKGETPEKCFEKWRERDGRKRVS